MAMLTFSICFTSCEKDSTTLPDTIVDANETTTIPALDSKFKSYEVVEIDNEVLWNSLESQSGETIKLDMKDTINNSDIANWSFDMTRMHIEAEDFKLHVIGEDGLPTEVNLPTPYVMQEALTDGSSMAFIIPTSHWKG